jgi:hypothetical protein
MTQPINDVTERNEQTDDTGQTRLGRATQNTILAAHAVVCVVLFSLYIRVSDYWFYEVRCLDRLVKGQ